MARVAAPIAARAELTVHEHVGLARPHGDIALAQQARLEFELDSHRYSVSVRLAFCRCRICRRCDRIVALRASRNPVSI
jgi:hypothetical protein